MTVNKPSALLHPTQASWLRGKQPIDRRRFTLGQKGKQHWPQTYITTSIPSEEAFCTQMIRGFSCTGLTHALNTQRQRRDASWGLKMQWKAQDYFDPIYFTSTFWRHPLTCLQGSLCWKCQVPIVYTHFQNRYSVATPEFLKKLPQNHVLSNVYTISEKCRWRTWAMKSQSFLLSHKFL